MGAAIEVPEPLKRKFVPSNFQVTTWAELDVYYRSLVERPLLSVAALERWILDRSELDAVVSESFSWRYIKITVDSSDEAADEAYQYAVQELSPRIAAYENTLNHKLVACPYTSQLDPVKYGIYLRNIQNEVDLFHEENIPLATEVQLKAKEYGRIFSEMTIGVNGRQMTLQKAGALLEETDREYREAIYHKIYGRILEDTECLESLFDDLLVKRHQIALNSGFDNFRDFKFRALGRFDYSISDCLDFHEAIQLEILPLLDDFNRFRKKALNLEQLRPWDLHVDTSKKAPLKPFNDINELVEKSVACLSSVNPLFGKVIGTMQQMGHLDLESRKGKRPGGYNMPLHLTGVPFVFMNASNSTNDMRTLMHESGHAVHSYLTKGLKLTSDKKVPSEVAELAAMTMELLTMDHWGLFFDSEEDLRRARISQLENVLKVLPWVATVDKFQHWLYTHPEHTREERKISWMETFLSYSSDEVDRSGLEYYSEYVWHKQLHIFEVPFYYIEYGMAQLGAVAIWKAYRENPELTVQRYISALKLGYSRPIKEIYETAGIRFDFSRAYVKELGAFIKHELDTLLTMES
ncbi:MAG: M3 family oligoendopeptidase [Lewinellaceae bacterium]|nr:M3 family oligoendopeptidase [Lewinella sp.]MCB9279496.1 M3 family oligoendopeptidase [Lewinellaceae bacterium]